ncbi:uncharacterized protein LALA0_S02e07206g [Lachancea lanzarotensis]|uniref:Guanine nucleotide-exchange factor SEC12 n=1 Tax=Lachancea lanzarotensis TaxID=1245769 RepID=A0A0C7MZS8_9SACH|nr:uncharacterized protein LALA0_S02e07206g [Lachancea lanzarotensis]CEP61122.1 LALA0S02e07206g1_1 [Lachancea lanzarotensis]
MKVQESVYSIGYPIYGARFLNNNVLLVTGGGGEGNNGIPNKLTALQVNFEKRKVIKRFRELALDSNDDSPTTLDAANNIILMGCNESSAKIRAGQPNHHLRKYVFENEHLKFVASVDMDRSKNAEDYTKLTYMSQDGSVAAIASSKLPTVIRILNPALLTETYEIETGNDVKDLHFSPDGKVLSYITSSTLEVISIVTGRFIVRKTDFNENWTLSKIRFIGEDTVVIAAALKKGSGIVLCKVSLKSGTTSVLKTKIVTTKIKGVTSMDVDPKGQLAALAGNDNSVLVVRLKSLTVAKFFKQVHSFAITRVVFSPDGNALVSVSAANTIHAIRVPDNLASSTSFVEKVVKLLINFVLIVVFAAILQVTYKYDLHQRVYQFALTKWNARNDSFKLNDEFAQTTLVGDVVSIQTKTRGAPTHDGPVTTPTSYTATSEILGFLSVSEVVQSSGIVQPSADDYLTSSYSTWGSNKDSGQYYDSSTETEADTAASADPTASSLLSPSETYREKSISSTAESGVEDLTTPVNLDDDEASKISTEEGTASTLDVSYTDSNTVENQFRTSNVPKETAAKSGSSRLTDSEDYCEESNYECASDTLGSSDKDSDLLASSTIASTAHTHAFSTKDTGSDSLPSTTSGLFTSSDGKVSKTSVAISIPQYTSLLSVKGSSVSDSETIGLSQPASQTSTRVGETREAFMTVGTTSENNSILQKSTAIQGKAISISFSDVSQARKSSSSQTSAAPVSIFAKSTQLAASSNVADAESTQETNSEVKSAKAGILTSKRGQQTENLNTVESTFGKGPGEKSVVPSENASTFSQGQKLTSSDTTSIAVPEDTERSVGSDLVSEATLPPKTKSTALTSSWEKQSTSSAAVHVSSAVPDDFEQNYTPDVSVIADDGSTTAGVTPDAASLYVDEPAPIDEVDPIPEATAEAQNANEESSLGEHTTHLAAADTDFAAKHSKEDKLLEHDEL